MKTKQNIENKKKQVATNGKRTKKNSNEINIIKSHDDDNSTKKTDTHT